MEKIANKNRDRILKLSILLIEKQGMEKFSLRNLANKLSMDPMVVYYYFSSKDDLIMSCIESVFNKELNLHEFHFQEESRVSRKKREKFKYFELKRLIEIYRNIFILYPNLCIYLINHSFNRVKKLQEFNQILVLEISKWESNLILTTQIRDILVDYVHGFSLTALTQTKNKKLFKQEKEIEFHKTLEFLLEKLLK
ncbi:MAG: TetR/AcrR family transcriptional regulator [Leptospiraceae bacterium]|nr:TetR/AcrR family transcriptional regulator [Leptospiraceae bacterium]